MDDTDRLNVGRLWEQNAENWTRLSREGYDVYRDYLNTPWFLDMLPDVSGLDGLDIGCGEGHNTRQVARRGARMWGIDIAPTFIRYAREAETDEPLGIRYTAADALALPFDDDRFHFCTAFMSLMDVPENERALAEAYRVLKPDGFLQFSITHPCFDTPHRDNIRDENGVTQAIQVGGYFERIDGRIDEWLFGAAPREVKAGLEPFRVPRFCRTLSWWINAVVDAGFQIERVGEPTASDETVAACPDMQDTQVAGYFMHVRCRKS